MHRENEILFMKVGLHAQHGCHAHNSSTESVGRYSQFVQMMTQRCPILWQGQFWKLAFTWKNVKTLDFFKTIAARDLELDRCRQLVGASAIKVLVFKVKVIS